MFINAHHVKPTSASSLQSLLHGAKAASVSIPPWALSTSLLVSASFTHVSSLLLVEDQLSLSLPLPDHFEDVLALPAEQSHIQIHSTPKALQVRTTTILHNLKQHYITNQLHPLWNEDLQWLS